MNRFEAVVWGVCGAIVAGIGLNVIIMAADFTSWILGAAMLGIAVWMGLRAWTIWHSPNVRRQADPHRALFPRSDALQFDAQHSDVSPVALETQIANFTSLGLTLNKASSIEVLLQSFDRSEFESDPYQLLLFMACSEFEVEVPSEDGSTARYHSQWGWNFDTECLVQQGDYVTIVESLVRLTGQLDLLVSAQDTFNINAPTAELEYTIKGVSRRLELIVNGDWADVVRLMPLFRDIEAQTADGREFWFGDNGQSILVLFVRAETAQGLNELSPGLVVRPDFDNVDTGSA